MCRLQNIALKSVTDGRTDRQTDRQTDRRTDRQTDDGQSDPYVSLCFAGDTIKRGMIYWYYNNTSDKETSFLDLNIKVIGSDIHTSVYDKRDDLGFPIVNFPWLSGDVPRLPSYGIYISQLVRFARCCTSVLDFHSKNLQITSKLLTRL